MKGRFLAALGMTLVLSSTATAQNAESVFARARQLVQAGNGAAGRLLVDSVLTSASPETPLYGEALYWRGALASSSADAERDFRFRAFGEPHQFEGSFRRPRSGRKRRLHDRFRY